MKKTSSEHKQIILDKIKEAGDAENYVTDWEKGYPISKLKKNVKKGSSSKARGNRFELKVRHDLESKGRFVDKWNNNIDLEENKLIIAKRKYNPFSKVMTLGTGFPDFITIKPVGESLYQVIGVEVKINGILSKIEKEKCKWYLDKKIFSEIWIAKENKVGRKSEVVYEDFKERYIKNKLN